MQLQFLCTHTGEAAVSLSMNRKSHKAKRDKKEQSEKHAHFWPMRILSQSAKVNKQQDPPSDCFHLMGGAGWEMVFLCCRSTLSCPWKNFGSVIGWNASLTICAVSVKRIQQEELPPTPEQTGPWIMYLVLQVSTGIWPLSSTGPAEHPDHRGKRFPRPSLCSLSFETFPLQLVLPLHVPSAVLHRLCWTAWLRPRNTGTSVFTASFILDKAPLFKKQQKSSAT